MPTTHSLNEIQRWLQAVITHPDGVRVGAASAAASNFLAEPPDDIEQIILPSSQMSSSDRLQIYGRAYFGRLIECLRAQFAAVHRAIGDLAFDGLAFGYLVQHPSTNYTLGSLGDSFDAHLAATRPPRAEQQDSTEPDFADFLIDLARLERTYNVIFDGPGPECCRSLDPSDFAGLSAEDFADCQLVPHECVRLLELRFPVHEYATSIRRGSEPVFPMARLLYLVVTRRDYVVRRFEVSRQQFDLLSALIRQETVGAALETISAGSNAASLGNDLQTWFYDWSAAPLFAKLVRGRPH